MMVARDLMCLMPLTCVLKKWLKLLCVNYTQNEKTILKMANFMSCIFYHNKKTKPKKQCTELESSQQLRNSPGEEKPSMLCGINEIGTTGK